MLTVRNLELKRTFVGGDYRNMKFTTTAEVQIGVGYSSKAILTLTDEQTAKVVDFILGLIRESMSVEMEKPEPIEDAPARHVAVEVDDSVLEPL